MLVGDDLALNSLHALSAQPYGAPRVRNGPTELPEGIAPVRNDAAYHHFQLTCPGFSATRTNGAKHSFQHFTEFSEFSSRPHQG